MFWAASILATATLGHGGILADASGPLWLLPAIDIGPNILFQLGPFPFTNTLFDSWLSMALILGLFIPATRKMAIVPKGLQNFVEWSTQLLMEFCEEIAGREWGRKLFPFIGTLFFYILFSNWASLIPGVDAFGTPNPAPGQHLHPVLGIFLFGADSNKITPWFRPASTDLNFTLALAIISVVVTQIYGFRVLGIRVHVGKYLNFKEPIGFIVGILEIVAEFARILSFSFRLFGNVFAGDVLLLVMGTLLPFVGPIVFYPLELFVGFIQAFVFAALTLVFLTLAIVSHDEAEHAPAAH